MTYNFEVTGVENIFSAGQLLPAPDSRRGRMLVWGYMPEWYVWSGRTPATRDIITFNEIWPNPNRDYFRDILLADLRNNPPDYITDAVAPGSFGFTKPEKDGIQTFPELAAFVSADYVLLSPESSAGSCPRVFARKDAAAAIEKRYAKPSRVYDSAARVVGPELASVVDNLTLSSCSRRMVAARWSTRRDHAGIGERAGDRHDRDAQHERRGRRKPRVQDHARDGLSWRRHGHGQGGADASIPVFDRGRGSRERWFDR